MAGYSGTFVVPWSQTEVDGLPGAPVGALEVGASWRWSGSPVRVDGANDLLILEGPLGDGELRQRAARAARRMVGHAIQPLRPDVRGFADEPLFDRHFVVTEGRREYAITLIELAETARPLLLFLGEMPPADRDLWVVRCPGERVLVAPRTAAVPPGVICFAAGTLVRTPDGDRRVEDLTQGDTVCTRDNGAQPLQWTGHRRMTGARLHALPALRPVRIRTDALGLNVPTPDLVVSPQHRILVRGAAAEALFNEPEVLVAAIDLVNDRSVTVEHGRREVVYHHLMLPAHNVLWANGVASESFHPAHTALDSIPDDQRAAMFATDPELAEDPTVFGAAARRLLSAAEAAVMLSEARGMAHRRTGAVREVAHVMS
ncbi:Hint domain-containing protein [Oceaniglobus indicus]|uniref:Hint domain-containing protein n=1 Tax=Oceaniglobus indicus TaxID=2047749 RepID=UPI000C183166|nr:Hint domain-containing protein [Oceaniglobus indicus]